MDNSYAQYVTAVTTQLNNVPQQMQSLLQNTVQYDANWTDPGTSFFLDDRGKTDPKEVQGKGGRIEPRELNGERRGGNFVGDEDWFYVYGQDKARMLLDPTSADMRSLMAGKERKKDYDIINNLMFGLTPMATGGPGASALDTTEALPNSQIIALADRRNIHDTEKPIIATNGSLHLTVGKLITTRNLLKRSHVGDVMKPKMHIAVDENAKGNLLASVATTSKYFNDITALVNGDVDTFMGFQFHEFSSLDGPLPYYVSGGINCVIYAAWIDSAVYYKERPIENVNVAKDIGIKSHPLQVYYMRERAWARRYKNGVVRIECTQDRQLQ
jgi:hypothetical protein